MIARGNWSILIGGRGRQGILREIRDREISVDNVVFPFGQETKLQDAVALAEDLGFGWRFANRHLGDLAPSADPSGLLSVGWPFLVSPETIAKFNWAINVHPTLLPRYAGPSSGAHVIINGETETGSTVHYMTSRVDSGPIVAQSKVSIGSFDTTRSLQKKVYRTEPELVVRSIFLVESGFPGVPFERDDSTFYPNLRTPRDSQINPKESIEDLFDFIRSCDPDHFPAHFYHHGEKVCIRLWRPEKLELDEDLL